MAKLQKKKRPGHREEVRHAKFKGAGARASAKTRPDVPSTPANKAATGKQVRGKGGSGGRGRGKG
jgi:hypothetical protein